MSAPQAGVWGYWLRTPRWWALTLLVVLLAVGFYRLGLWQLHNATSNAQQEVAEAARARPVVPVDEVVPAGESFPAAERGRTVTLEGEFTGEQFMVPERRLDERTGTWVLARVESEGGVDTAVLRGFVPGPTPEEVPPLPDGLQDAPVTVRGQLEASEEPLATTGQPEGVLGSVDLAWLANQWDGPVRSAWLFGLEATGEEGQEIPLRAGSMEVVPAPPPEAAGLDWQNAGYAIQWWLFALFGIWVAWRMLQDDASRAAATGSPEHPGGAPSEGAGDRVQP
ncbi:Cytochrome oxidase assembly protein ShyY1 [Kytococcus aerolatus]|uniref:SURF1-like protein n=1 Tax=Kytococcus aerolatus TaxID=592308 RepID=A0A212TZ71_9MICO|nr:SURF1 family protein [Kytococcus aerolatus]SNC71307.1 Cytochrome oxidase assembly protein ShyY1 [Kytococcus aerolatus]